MLDPFDPGECVRPTFAIVLGLPAMLACREPTIAAEDPPPPSEPEIVPVAVHTEAPERVQAGDIVLVRCSIEDAGGEDFEGLPAVVRVVPDSSVTVDGEVIEAVRTGTLEIVCTYPDANLVDDTPALTVVDPGPAAWIDTTVDRSSLEAGTALTASCDVFDAFDNLVPDAAPGVRLLPEVSGTTVQGLRATPTLTGMYEASCTLPGAVANSRQVEVLPTLPADLTIARVPDLPVYALGQTVSIEALVTDRFGNRVSDAAVDVVSQPDGTSFGAAAYRYFAEGDYTLTATVAPPIEGGGSLVATTDITVNGVGPEIQCDAPLDGSMITATPGSTVTMSGRVLDPQSVTSLTVDGQPVTVASDGSFATDLPIHFGHHFVDLVATDGFGEQSTRTCSFLAAPAWQPEDQLFADAISLSLFQGAIDDGDRTSLNSFADLLAAVVDDPGLIDSLDQALLAANPLKNSCDQSLFGACIFRSRIDYRSASVIGPNDSQLTLVDDGLDASITVRGVELDVDLSGTITTGVLVRFDTVSIDIGFDLALDGSGPSASVRSSQVSLSGLDVQLSGVPGFIEDILVALFGGLISDLVEDLLRDQIESQFGALLTDLVSGLDVSALSAVVDVPRLDGTGTVPLSFGLGFSSLDTTPSRLRFGIATQLSAPAGIATPSLGVAQPPGPVLVDPSAPQSAAVAIHVGLFNQALHTLWRAGLFEADLEASEFGGGLPARLSSSLPPVARLTDDGIDLGIGPLNPRPDVPRAVRRILRVGDRCRSGGRGGPDGR